MLRSFISSRLVSKAVFRDAQTKVGLVPITVRSLPLLHSAFRWAPSLHAAAQDAKLNQRPVRWGILSAGKISSDFAKAITFTEGAKATGIAARSAIDAKQFAARHGIPTAYGSYEELIKDPNIDVVYVGSVAHTHASLVRQALLADKPVVVEKPLALSFDECEELVQLARELNVFMTEGMWTRCFPAMKEIRRIISQVDSIIGDAVMVQGDFGWSTAECSPNDRIWNSLSGGGMTLDVGMYLIQMGQIAFPGAVVQRVDAVGSSKNGVDHTVAANIVYEKLDGGKGFLQFYVTGEANTEERIVIQGTKGRITINSPAHVPQSFKLTVEKERGNAIEQHFVFPVPDGSFTSWNYPGSIGFTYQIQDVNEALRAGKKQLDHYTLDDALQVASILDGILGKVQHGTAKTIRRILK